MTVYVFYLARAQEGLKPFADFAASYRRFPAGCDHRLVIIYKGSGTEPETALKEIKDDAIFVSDDLTDIGAYLEASARFPFAEYVCFLNTFSVIFAEYWLLHLCRALSAPTVGIAGATASYESLYDTLAYTGKAVWLTEIRHSIIHVGMMQQFEPYLRLHSPQWVSRYAAASSAKKILSFFRAPYKSAENTAYADYWASVSAAGGPLGHVRDIPRFPNPHIRSNGFIIRRTDLVREFPSIKPGKNAAYEFESGAHGITARLLAAGKTAVLVDRNGRTYLPRDWPKSRTFRLGQQVGLMIGDNQTRRFAVMPRAEQQTHVYFTWGRRPPFPRRFLTLGIPFRVPENFDWTGRRPTV